MQAMLLAAGLGTRLRPHTLVRPKPLFPVLNRPLLEILLDMLDLAGCGRVVVNAHHLADQVERVTSRRKGVVFQFEPEILGTGGSLREALPNFTDEPLLVMNGDIFHDIDLKALYAHHLRSGNRITLALHDFPRFNTVGIEGEKVRTFSVRPGGNPGDVLAFTGIHVVEPEVIGMIPEGRFFHVIDLYEQLASQGGGVGYVRVDGSCWRDIGTPEDYLDLHAMLLSGAVEQRLPVGSPPSGPWLVAENARLDEGVILDGWGCVGRAHIGRGARLKDCVVWDGAVIPPGAECNHEIVTPEINSEG
ncbi:MAG: NDP-sugar synthase [Desulfobulbaceae bacterium]